MSWRTWLKGIAAAAIGGAATGVTHALATSDTLNSATLTTAAAGALITVLAYLAKSPLGGDAPADPPAAVRQ